MSATANREDTFGSRQRGEETSRLETRLESEFESSAMEGLHAEDCPQLVKSIQAAQKMGQDDEAAAEDVRKEYLAATADGSVRRLQGDPDVKAILPEAGDNEWDRLKKKRLADMKQRAAQRQAWREKGHGVYAVLESEARFLQELPQHERAVCHLFQQGSVDGELLHRHMQVLCAVHVETYFCRLDCELAPVMMQMVSLAQMPALLLCRAGKVVGQLTGVDRSFTSEGLAFELSQAGMLDFEDGTQYARTTGGCTAATAGRGGEGGEGSADEGRRAVYSDEDDDISD